MRRSGSVKPHYHSSGNNSHSNNRQQHSYYNSNNHNSSHSAIPHVNSPNHRNPSSITTSNQRVSNNKAYINQNGSNNALNHNSRNFTQHASYNNSKSNYNPSSPGSKSNYGTNSKPNYSSGNSRNRSNYDNHYKSDYNKPNYKSNNNKSQSCHNDNSISYKQKLDGNQSKSSSNSMHKDSNYADPRYSSSKNLNGSTSKSVSFNKSTHNYVSNGPKYPSNKSINNSSPKSMTSNVPKYAQNKNCLLDSKNGNFKSSDDMYLSSKSGSNKKVNDSLSKSQANNRILNDSSVKPKQQSNNGNFNSKSTFNNSSYHGQNKKFGNRPNSNIRVKSNTNNSSKLSIPSTNLNKTNHARFNSVQPSKMNPQTQDGRKEIAKKTLDIIKSGQYNTNQGTVNIKKDIEDCVKKTKTINPKHYSKDWKPQSRQPGKMCQFEVLPESSFGAARKLVKDNKKTCVLNFASATKPGGGFINGKQAQEESLSRQSALYKSLESQKEMYDKHKKINDNYYTDYMIYSPEVPVFRNDQDESLLPESFKASVITSAAPNKTKIDEEKYSPTSAQKKQELGTLIKDRCRKIVQCAIDEKNDALVLGAYGCGVFGNDPKEVSKAFKEVLVDEGYGKYFDKVVFAIPGQHSNNFRVFSSEFPPSTE